MNSVNNTELLNRLEKIEKMLRHTASKMYYNVDEFAILANRAPFTVRQWCNDGRINAEKSQTRSGSCTRWVISHEEYLRFQRNGLLAQTKCGRRSAELASQQ